MLCFFVFPVVGARFQSLLGFRYIGGDLCIFLKTWGEGGSEIEDSCPHTEGSQLQKTKNNIVIFTICCTDGTFFKMKDSFQDGGALVSQSSLHLP